MSGKSWSVISPTIVIKHISIKVVQNLKKKKKSLPSNLHMVKMTMSSSKNLWPKHTHKKNNKIFDASGNKWSTYTLSSFLNIFISGSLNMLMIYFATEMHHNIYVLGCGIKNSSWIFITGEPLWSLLYWAEIYFSSVWIWFFFPFVLSEPEQVMVGWTKYGLFWAIDLAL